MIPAFTEVLNASISASWLVLVIASLRCLLKNAPKWMLCALWALVAVRLLCPVSIISDLSLVPSAQTVPEEYLYMEGTLREKPVSLEIVENPSLGENVRIELETTVDRVQLWDLSSTLVWMTGMGVMLIYGIYSYFSLRLRVRFAAASGAGIWICDDISSPFILGLFRPRIYLPSTLDQETAGHVIAHERAHLKRMDHLWKPLGFALLVIHWFNPIMWLAYILLCQDIELACDERVIRDMDRASVRAYSEALVSCSVRTRMITACPLAFGEVGVTGRIKAMLHYKKPGFWMMVLTIAAAALAAVSFLTDPPAREPELNRICAEDGWIITSQQNQQIYVMLYKHTLPENVLNGYEHTFEPGQIEVWSGHDDSTSLSLIAARMSGSDLLLTFDFEYALPAAGQITLPYRMMEGEKDFSMTCTGLHDFTADYSKQPVVSNYGGGTKFSVRMDLEIYRNADDYVAFWLEGMNLLTYIREDTDIRPLMDRNHTLGQTVWSASDTALLPENVTVYYISPELQLWMGQGSQWGDISHHMGNLYPVELSGAWFDDLFTLVDGQSADVNAASLRRENDSAWRADSLYGETEISHLLLHQKNGEAYMLMLTDDGQTLLQVMRLHVGTENVEPGTVSFRSYEYSPELGFGTTTFRLFSDGTFTLSEAMYSSYLGYGRYTLSGTALELRTDDGDYVWRFTADGDGFRFDAESSSVLRNWPGGKNGLVELEDGARFTLTGITTVVEPTASVELPEQFDLENTILCYGYRNEIVENDLDSSGKDRVQP